jgi:hypothetical protein
MKRLFISDLDGTLFDNNAHITECTAGIINEYVGKGMNFTFATARSVYSARPLTKMLNINVPCILMNGVSIYDLQTERYIKNEFIPKQAAYDIIAAFERNNVHCFMYKIQCDILTAYYTEINGEVMRKFAEERKNCFRKPFVQCEKFPVDDEIVYFTTTGDAQQLLPVKNEIAALRDVDFAFYEDTYTKKYYLEVFSAKASKANGIKFLRENYGFDEVICFGDNLNDLPMFRESDIRVAVGNAKDEVKAAADYTALSNSENGVAMWMRSFLL